MKSDELLRVYTDEYAGTYDDRFLLPSHVRPNVEFELSVLRAQLVQDARWLDVACGTGYMLGQFPGVARAGLDKSPGMLSRARLTNPDALFLQEGDFRDPRPEWRGCWSLVSCMWGAYVYVDSVNEVEQLVANLISWTRHGGALFLPLMDIEDLRTAAPPSYEEFAAGFGGSTIVVAHIWSWREGSSGQVHENLVSPQLDHFLRLMSPHFEKIEVLRYPATELHWPPRKALLATGRRVDPDPLKPAEVIRHPLPDHPRSVSRPSSTDGAAALPGRVLVGELARRISPMRLARALRRRLGMG